MHQHLGRGNTQHSLVGIRAPGSGHRQLARRVGELRDIFSFSHLISRDGGQIQPIPHGCLGSTPSGIRDLVRESRVQSNRQRLPHGAPLAQTQPRHSDFTSPAQQALGPSFATSTRLREWRYLIKPLNPKLETRGGEALPRSKKRLEIHLKFPLIDT